MSDTEQKKHVCGPCGQGFDTEEEYLDHKCEKSGATPKDIEHLEATTTPDASKIAEAAQARGEERKEE